MVGIHQFPTDSLAKYGLLHLYQVFGQNSPPLSLVTLDTQEKIRQVLSQGYKITVEYVDKRRFSMGSWQTCGNLHTSDYAQAISALESCLLEHAGEYVRLVVIDPKLKRRVIETIIQRP